MTDAINTAATSITSSIGGQRQERRPYAAPRIESLGAWSALTLTLSVPVGPGGMVYGGPTDA